ncbi:hypothetical protein D3C73_1207700 [compost metagenome]
MSDRDAGISRYADRRGDARHDLIRNAIAPKKLGLLAHPAEYRRVAALQPDNRLALQGQIDEQPVDFLLLHRVPVGQLADIYFLPAGRHPFQEPRTRKPVIDQHIRFLDAIHSFNRNQPGVSGTCSHQIDLPLHLLIPLAVTECSPLLWRSAPPPPVPRA